MKSLTLSNNDFVDESKNFIKIPEAKNLRTKGLQKQLSVIKYIYNNTILILY